MANVLYGYENTHKISIDNIVQHTLSVRKGIKKSLLVVDMPKILTAILRKPKLMQNY